MNLAPHRCKYSSNCLSASLQERLSLVYMAIESILLRDSALETIHWTPFLSILWMLQDTKAPLAKHRSDLGKVGPKANTNRAHTNRATIRSQIKFMKRSSQIHTEVSKQAKHEQFWLYRSMRVCVCVCYKKSKTTTAFLYFVDLAAVCCLSMLKHCASLNAVGLTHIVLVALSSWLLPSPMICRPCFPSVV